ncbi:hypothetical protein TNCV_127921 [Trichonephila clavipes]|nr:hypothetical protein TNCV_127921 [Trichonephila clavipes]
MGCCTTELSYRLVLPEGKEEKLPQPETGWTSRYTPVVGRSLEHHTVKRNFESEIGDCYGVREIIVEIIRVLEKGSDGSFQDVAQCPPVSVEWKFG